MSGIRSSEELWAAVHAALDERRDPLADEGVATWLASRAEDLEEVLRLDGRLRALARPRRRRLAVPALVLAAGVAALILFLRREPVIPRAPAAARSEVLDYRLSVATETPTLRVAATLENGRLLREREVRLAAGGVATARLTTTTRKAPIR